MNKLKQIQITVKILRTYNILLRWIAEKRVELLMFSRWIERASFKIWNIFQNLYQNQEQ